MRKMVATERFTYSEVEPNKREGRVWLASMGMCAMASRFFRLDDRLEGVGELADDVDAERRLAGESAETAGGVGHVRSRDLSDHPAPEHLKALLHPGEVRDLGHLAVADRHVRLAAEDRRDEARYVRRGVLVVGVGVDDDVGAELQARVEAGHEAAGETLVPGKAQDVIGSIGEGHLPGAVLRTVIDHEHQDFVDSLDPPGNGAQRRRERFFLVQAGDLDNELHAREGR
jgi:hypothetical protein